jgi:hypothetical protein
VHKNKHVLAFIIDKALDDLLDYRSIIVKCLREKVIMISVATTWKARLDSCIILMLQTFGQLLICLWRMEGTLDDDDGDVFGV